MSITAEVEVDVALAEGAGMEVEEDMASKVRMVKGMVDEVVADRPTIVIMAEEVAMAVEVVVMEGSGVADLIVVSHRLRPPSTRCQVFKVNGRMVRIRKEQEVKIVYDDTNGKLNSMVVYSITGKQLSQA